VGVGNSADQLQKGQTMPETQDTTKTLAELVQLINDAEIAIERAEGARAILSENLPAYWEALIVAYFDDGMTLKAIGKLATPARSDDAINGDLARAMFAKACPKMSADSIIGKTKGMNNVGMPTIGEVKGALGLPPRSRKWNKPKAVDAVDAVGALFGTAKAVKPTGKTAKAVAPVKSDGMPKPGAKPVDAFSQLERALEEYLKACPDYETFRKNVSVMVAHFNPAPVPGKVNA
jgi:hypothetical protein